MQDCIRSLSYSNCTQDCKRSLSYSNCSHSQQEKNSISIYAFLLILCMFTMYVCCISSVFVGWLVGFVASRPKSAAMVIAGRSVHLTTLFPGQA